MRLTRLTSRPRITTIPRTWSVRGVVAVLILTAYLAAYLPSWSSSISKAGSLWSSQVSLAVPLAAYLAAAGPLSCEAQGLRSMMLAVTRPRGRALMTMIGIPLLIMLLGLFGSWATVSTVSSLATGTMSWPWLRLVHLTCWVAAAAGAGLAGGSAVVRALRSPSGRVASVAAVGVAVVVTVVLFLAPVALPNASSFDIIPMASDLSPWERPGTRFTMTSSAVLAAIAGAGYAVAHVLFYGGGGRRGVSSPAAALAPGTTIVVGVVAVVVSGAVPATAAVVPSDPGTRASCVTSRGIEVCWWRGEGDDEASAVALAAAAADTYRLLPPGRYPTVITAPGIRTDGPSVGLYQEMPVTTDGRYWLATDLVLLGPCGGDTYTDHHQLDVHAVIAMAAGASAGYDEEATAFAAEKLRDSPRAELRALIDDELVAFRCDAS